MAGAWGGHWSHGGQGWGFCRGSLGAQASSLARGVPAPSLDPRRTPASSDKRPSASMGLGNRGPGCEQLAYVAANPQTPPSRPHHCEDPPVLPSVKGSPFTDGRTGGRPPGDGFPPSRGCLVWGPEAGRACAGRPPQHKPVCEQQAPPLRYLARFTGSLGSCPWNWKLSPPPGGPFLFPWTTLASPSPTPAQAECQGTTRDLGTGRGAGHGSAPGGAGPGGRDPRPGTRSPGGSRA